MIFLHSLIVGSHKSVNVKRQMIQFPKHLNPIVLAIDVNEGEIDTQIKYVPHTRFPLKLSNHTKLT